MKIEENDMYEALMYLSGTDEELARLHADMGRAEHAAKKIKDAMFIHGQGTVEARKAQAGDSKEYDVAINEYFDAVAEHDAVDNKRKTAELKIRAWQTLAANRRQGQI